MCVYMYECVYMCIHVYMYVHVYKCVCVCVDHKSTLIVCLSFGGRGSYQVRSLLVQLDWQSAGAKDPPLPALHWDYSCPADS